MPEDLSDFITQTEKAIESSGVDQLKVAKQTPGVQPVEEDAVKRDIAEKADKSSTTTRFAKGVVAGAGQIIEAVGSEATVRTHAAIETFNEDESVLEIVKELVGIGKHFDDPEWNPRENKEQRDTIRNELTRLNLDPTSPEAEELQSSGSQFDYDITVSRIELNRKKAADIQASGTAGLVGHLIGGVLDADSLAGVGVYNKLAKAGYLKDVAKLQSAGKITAAEATAMQTVRTKGVAIKQGTLAAAVPTAVGESVRASIDPSMTGGDALAATAIAATLGAGTGAVTGKSVNSLLSDVNTARAYKAMRELNPIKPSVFSRADSFVQRAEGGLADVQGDRGKETAFGISSRFFPQQYKEVTKVLKEKGTKAAQAYAKSFRKENFYTKLDLDNLDPAMATVVYDTAVHSGLSKAKKLLKESDGDVNKYLDLREEFLTKLSDKPDQGQFKAGWLNRVANLRREVNEPLAPQDRVRRTIDDEQSIGSSGFERTDVLRSESSLAIDDLLDDWVDNNRDIVDSMQASGQFVDETANARSQLVQRAGQTWKHYLDKTPFRTDYDRLINDAPRTGEYLAYQLLESPLGSAVNNRSVVSVSEQLQTEADILWAPNSRRHFQDWKKANGSKYPVLSREGLTQKAYDDFNRELYQYREAVANGVPTNAHRSIVAASEELDLAYKKSLESAQKYGVEGFEDIQFKPGHTPRSWSGARLAQIENLAGVGTPRIIQSLKKSILKKNPDLDDQRAFGFAIAIRNHALSGQTGSLMSSLSTINKEGRNALEQSLFQNGAVSTIEEAKKLADAMLFQSSDRGTVKSSRARIDLNLLEPIEGTTYTLLDLVDTNVYGLTAKTTRAQSNYAGLASVGIQKRDREAWIQNAVDNANAEGADAAKASRVVEDIFSYFDEGAFVGGSGKFASRINKLARLSLLGQLGITQIAEAGVAIGAGGLKAYTKYMGKTWGEMLSGVEPKLMDSLSAANKYVADQDLVFRVDDLDDMQLKNSSTLMKAVDRAMDSGMRGMGHISGFYKSTEFLQRTAAMTMNNYMVTGILSGKMTPRLRSMGVDDDFAALIRHHYDEGNIKLDADGHVTDMGVLNWKQGDADLLRRVTRRNIDQTVQKTRPGEGHAWQYTELGSLFASLKSFSMAAMHKQLLRNAKLADPEATAMLLATTATAGLAFAAKQIVNFNTDTLTDPSKMAAGALQWSSLLSPAFMAIDPITYALGIDINHRYNSGGLMSLPPGVAMANDLMKLGRIPSDLTDGELSWESKRALMAIPVVGRTYGVKPLIESLGE